MSENYMIFQSTPAESSEIRELWESAECKGLRQPRGLPLGWKAYPVEWMPDCGRVYMSEDSDNWIPAHSLNTGRIMQEGLVFNARYPSIVLCGWLYGDVFDIENIEPVCCSCRRDDYPSYAIFRPYLKQERL